MVPVAPGGAPRLFISWSRSRLPALLASSSGSEDGELLQFDEMDDAAAGELEERSELGLGERRAFRRPLDFDNAAGAGHDEVRVGMRLDVLAVIEGENWQAAENAGRDGGDMVGKDRFRQHLARPHPLDAVAKRHPAASDRRRGRAAVGLDDVAVDEDLELAELD